MRKVGVEWLWKYTWNSSVNLNQRFILRRNSSITGVNNLCKKNIPYTTKDKGILSSCLNTSTTTKCNYNHRNRQFIRNLHVSVTTMGPIPNTNVKDAVDKFIKDNHVMIFSKSFCPFCKKVKGIFDNLKVKYVAHELDLDKENGQAIQDTLLEKTGQKTVPNTFINGIHLGGASDTEAALNDGRLKELLSGGKKYDYDLFVIGGGSGGLACSKEAVTHEGKKVAVADFVTPTPLGTTWGIGGTCVNVGCIPKKLMHQAALLRESLSDSNHYGWGVETVKLSHDWKKMVQAIQDHIASLNWGYKVQLRQENVEYFNSYTSFIDKHTLNLKDEEGNEKTVTAENIVLAMGGRPVYPNIPGVKEFCITSDDLFSLEYPPGKTLVCGASYISLECAGFLHGLGYDTTVMVRSIFLRGFDQEMANKAGDYMEEQGVKFLKKYNIVKVEQIEKGSPGKLRVTFRNPDGKEVIDEFNTVLMAVGRKPLIEGIGLENVGVNVNPKNGFIITDDYDHTNVDNIYAIGDLADGKPELTPVAIQAGQLLAKRIFGSGVDKCDYQNVPTTVFTPLEYGACGLSEEDAIEKYGDVNVEVYHANFTPLEAVVPGRLANACFAKIITNLSDNKRVLGIHVLGPNAGEVVQGFSIALKLGATKAHFDDLIGIHPTNAEVFTTINTTKRSGVNIDATGC